MATLEIVEIGHPTLREVAQEVPVDEIKTAPVQEFIDSLIETKRAANGAGIAANQVDNLWRIFVVEVVNNPRYPYKPDYPLTVVINPEITYLIEDRFENFEGCLSVPNLRGVVHRCPIIQVTGFNRDAEPVDFEVKGVAAGTFQHEMDHLNGVMFTDRTIDPRSFCSWSEFDKRYEDSFRQLVLEVEEAYNIDT